MIDKIKSIIGEIEDTKLKRKIKDLNLLKEIKADDSSINVYFEVIPPLQVLQCSTGTEMEEKLREAFPNHDVHVHIDEIDSKAKVKPADKIKKLIAISSGKGGVGKSTVTANLAIAFAQTGAKVAILDADIYGPSQPLMYGLKGQNMDAVERDGEVYAVPLEKYGVKVVSMGFALEENQAAILRGPMLASYFTMLFEQVDWGEVDYLFFDMPPGTGDIQLTMTQKIPLSGAVVVTTPQEVALADVRRSITMFNKVNVRNLGIIENMSYFVPPDMPDKKYYIFGEGGGKRIAQDNGVPFLGEIPLSMNIREGGDEGKPVTAIEPDSPQAKAFKEIAEKMIQTLNTSACAVKPQIKM